VHLRVRVKRRGDVRAEGTDGRVTDRGKAAGEPMNRTSLAGQRAGSGGPTPRRRGCRPGGPCCGGAVAVRVRRWGDRQTMHPGPPAWCGGRSQLRASSRLGQGGKACTGRVRFDPDARPATQTPYGRVEGPEAAEGPPGGAQAHRREPRRSRAPMRVAWPRVKATPGAGGLAGMASDACPALARQHWARLRSALAEGTDRPAAVLRLSSNPPTEA
jgi:hypothetical protein